MTTAGIASVHHRGQPGYYQSGQPQQTQQPRIYSTASNLPSSQTMVISNNLSLRLKRDTLSCDDIVDHCNNNSNDGNNSDNYSGNNRIILRNNTHATTNPYAKISLEKINCPSGQNSSFVVATPPHNHNMSQSYHPHSIFYGQQYHRIQPLSQQQQHQAFLSNCVNNVPIRLTDSFEHLQVQSRHSGSSFRSSNSPPSVVMTSSADENNVNLNENAYECIPAHFKQPVEAEAVTRFDSD